MRPRHPNLSFYRYTADRYYEGNVVTFGKNLIDRVSDDPVSAIKGVMAPFWGPAGIEAWCWVGAFGVFQAALQLLVPGTTFKGPVSPKGNVPVYKVSCHLQPLHKHLHDRNYTILTTTVLRKKD